MDCYMIIQPPPQYNVNKFIIKFRRKWNYSKNVLQKNYYKHELKMILL